ncbi:MAG: ankyrin repeat domain-containing protein [Spirochaetaceae bacterium]|nr:ankyrin repeat domain-containing protein [Spirochaetaceae bacterium]
MSEAIDGLERCLDYSQYTLCLPDADDFDTHWLHYILGYQRGRTDRLSFWVLQDNERIIPNWASRFIILTGHIDVVSNHFAGLEGLWSEDMNAKLARKVISERHIEISARSFVEAVRSGDRFFTGLFLDAGFSPSLRDSAGVPILNQAVRLGYHQLVGPLLDAGADIDSEAEDRGTTPLMDAAASGHTELILRLVDMNAELEHMSRDGQTAVILAVGNGREDAAAALIQAGANVEIKDKLGMSARKYADLYKLSRILEMIESTG